MRYVLAVAALLLLCLPSLASDEQVIQDCDYWRLGKDAAEVAKLLAACDVIINNKRFSKADRAMAFSERASHAAENNRDDDAIADLDQALALLPNKMEWRRSRAFLLHFKGEHDRAIADFDNVLAEQPDAHMTFYRGLSYLGKGDETRAFADFAKAIELDPDGYFYRYRRGLEYAKRGQLDAALADLDKAIALKSDFRDSYLLRAELFIKKGDTEKAITDLTRAAEFDPKYTVPYLNRVLLYEQTKQYDLALADYDKLLSIEPGNELFKERRAALMKKLAPEPSVPQGAWSFIKGIFDGFTFGPTAPPKEAAVAAPAPPPEKAAQPLPQPPAVEKKAAKQATVGKGECRRYDAIANMTISVACPE